MALAENTEHWDGKLGADDWTPCICARELASQAENNVIGRVEFVTLSSSKLSHSVTGCFENLIKSEKSCRSCLTNWLVIKMLLPH